METQNNIRSVERGDLEELRELLDRHDTALLMTRGADGHFHARPMAMQSDVDSVEELWFVTQDDSEKVHDLEHDGDCCVALVSNERASTYVSMSGTAELVRDPVRVRAVWNGGWNTWFPDGPDTPRLVLIRFAPAHAEYVRAATGRLAEVTEFVRSLVGRPTHAPKKELELH